MPDLAWTAAALALLGWTERGKDGRSFVFNNPTKPDSPVVWDPNDPGAYLAGQLEKAGVSRSELMEAAMKTMPTTPYTSIQNF